MWIVWKGSCACDRCFRPTDLLCVGSIAFLDQQERCKIFRIPYIGNLFVLTELIEPSFGCGPFSAIHRMKRGSLFCPPFSIENLSSDPDSRLNESYYIRIFAYSGSLQMVTAGGPDIVRSEISPFFSLFKSIVRCFLMCVGSRIFCISKRNQYL